MTFKTWISGYGIYEIEFEAKDRAEAEEMISRGELDLEDGYTQFVEFHSVVLDDEELALQRDLLEEVEEDEMEVSTNPLLSQLEQGTAKRLELLSEEQQ
jgi:hypothetical protein